MPQDGDTQKVVKRFRVVTVLPVFATRICANAMIHCAIQTLINRSTDTSQSDCIVSNQLLRNPLGSAIIHVVHKIDDLDGNDKQEKTFQYMVGVSVLVAFS